MLAPSALFEYLYYGSGAIIDILLFRCGDQHHILTSKVDLRSERVKGIVMYFTQEKELSVDTVDAEPHTVDDMKAKCVPGAPQHLSVVSVSSDGVSLEWKPPQDDGGADINSYIVVMREAEKNKFKKVAQTDNGTLSLTVSKVKENHEYFFRIYAENEVGISVDSAELKSSVNIPKKSKPTQPKEVTEPEQAKLSENIPEKKPEDVPQTKKQVCEDENIETNAEKVKQAHKKSAPKPGNKEEVKEELVDAVTTSKAEEVSLYD